MSGSEKTSLDLLSTCLLVTKFRFDTMLYCNLNNEDSDAVHIEFSRGTQVHQP